MASTLLPHQPRDPNDSSATSIFLPTVCLYDWWLIQAEEEIQGRRLGVAGFTSPKEGPVKRAVRVFKSAPITKVYEFSTLETADGVCVLVKGLMNKSLSTENGFPSEVCKHFVFGFPLNWEECVAEQGAGSAALKTSAEVNSHVPGQSSPSKRDQKTPEDHDRLKNKNQPSARRKRDSATERAEDFLGPDLPKDGREDPSSAPPLVKPRRSSRHRLGTLEEGNAKGETTRAGVIPPLQGTVRTPDSFKRSRSGRILLPRLAFWQNELPIYDANRNIAGVQGPNKVESRDGGNVSRRK
ncbi:kinetochore-associated protein KNL-2 homolog [Punica granatum]|uniref:Kinetochore-associated protein KNL-2 homolog n=1 Tax=Punica granatum TaxID=22663 RepID=A0A218XCA3_PUNGR|nr:kinetochore-associated protein KNL-2 homolog [Punica granatum]OWM82319.1 hypothetical protein CDL15_Pgr001893 [Punica granatum]